MTHECIIIGSSGSRPDYLFLQGSRNVMETLSPTPPFGVVVGTTPVPDEDYHAPFYVISSLYKIGVHVEVLYSCPSCRTYHLPIVSVLSLCRQVYMIELSVCSSCFTSSPEPIKLARRNFLRHGHRDGSTLWSVTTSGTLSPIYWCSVDTKGPQYYLYAVHYRKDSLGLKLLVRISPDKLQSRVLISSLFQAMAVV